MAAVEAMYFADMDMADRRDTTDPRFDRWLSRRLHEAYDSVLKEQLPPDMARLVQQLGARRSDEGERQHNRRPRRESEDEGTPGRQPSRDADGGRSSLLH